MSLSHSSNDIDKESHSSRSQIDVRQRGIFPSEHHLYHAIAKALYIGEPTRLAPADIPSYYAPTNQLVTTSSEKVWKVEAVDERKREALWLITEPFSSESLEDIDNWQIQLVTLSKDQGWIPVGDSLPFEQSWFEIGIRTPSDTLADSSLQVPNPSQNPFSTKRLGEPKVDPLTGSEIRWRSHNNLLFAEGFTETRGKMFDATHELWKHLAPGDRISVYMCAQDRGFQNICIGGSLKKFRLRSRPGLPIEIVRKVLRFAEYMNPNPRLLDIEYVYESKNGTWSVKADGMAESSELWMVTSPLPQRMLSSIAQVRVVTLSRDQGWGGDGSTRGSWFSLGILQKQPGGIYRPKPHPSVGYHVHLWESHSNRVGNPRFQIYEGKAFSAMEEPFNRLAPGDRLGVWIIAQYRGWENHAKDGKVQYWEYFEPTLLEKYAGEYEAKRQEREKAGGS